MNNGAVPQGLAYLESSNIILISNYTTNGKNSTITFLPLDSKENTFYRKIYEQNNSIHTGHVGGLTVGKDHLWISSKRGIYYCELSQVMNLPHLNVSSFPLKMRASFSTFHNSTLWIGEFGRSEGKYKTDESKKRLTSSGVYNNAWALGYRINDINNFKSDEPDFILSIPDIMQGLAFNDDYLITSHSQGTKNPSILRLYSNPLNYPKDEVNEGTDLWILDDRYLLKEIICPPMMEGITIINKSLYIIFESASKKYINSAIDISKNLYIIPLENIIDKN
ncbi:MAG: hypothetical protein PQJ58_00625 [Spirochaetales bacterium]|nr:hypothetical protein [Spirochaetales bacterium]